MHISCQINVKLIASLCLLLCIGGSPKGEHWYTNNYCSLNLNCMIFITQSTNVKQVFANGISNSMISCLLDLRETYLKDSGSMIIFSPILCNLAYN
jgi:hypothetical protein